MRIPDQCGSNLDHIVRNAEHCLRTMQTEVQLLGYNRAVVVHAICQHPVRELLGQQFLSPGIIDIYNRKPVGLWGNRETVAE